MKGIDEGQRLRQSIFGLTAVFSFLIFSAYLVLWKESNHDMRIAATSAILFLMGVFLSPRRDVTIFATFIFAGVRWAFGAIIAHDLRVIVAASVFLAVPVVMLVVDARKQKGSG